MIQNDTERIYFNQNLIYHKDKLYNSGGSLEISLCSSTTDYKTFSPPTLHISVIGENNLRRLCSLNYSDSVDLFISFKDVLANIDSIYSTNRSNVILKKYQFDRSIKFEFIQVQSIGDRVVTISIIHSSTDFAKVIVPYSVFSAFAIGILKYFVNEFVNISLNLSSRSLLTEILEQNKMIRNGIMILPSSLIEKNINLNSEEVIEEQKEPENKLIMDTIDDFDKFLGKDMENIDLPDLTDKKIIEEKPKNLENNSLLINKVLGKDLSVLETLLTASITRPDPIISIFESFRKSMNLTDENSFLPNISHNDLKSILYISKLLHDIYLNRYLIKNQPIPSGFPILRYNPDRLDDINSINLNLAYDLLLIVGFIKIFRSRMESRESDANKNGAIFYLRLRIFLDPLVYSFLDISKSKIIFNNICTNFEKYSELGFFNHYQNILKENGFDIILLNDIRSVCDELGNKVFNKDIMSTTINHKHNELYKSGFLRINSDNNLSIEQIINELVPLEVLEKNGADLSEGNESLQKFLSSISEEVLNIFHKKEIEKPKEEKVKKDNSTNLLKTVKYFNNEIIKTYRDDFFNYIENLKYDNYNFENDIYNSEEFGENIIKALYIWNESDDKKVPLTEFRSKLEDCLLTKDLILAKYKNKIENENSENWDLSLL